MIRRAAFSPRSPTVFHGNPALLANLRIKSTSLIIRIQSAILMINEVDLILKFANRAGFPWKTVGDLGEKAARRIIEGVPTYYVEREIALRLEAQTRPIEENDFRDMQSFCAIIPYAD